MLYIMLCNISQSKDKSSTPKSKGAEPMNIKIPQASFATQLLLNILLLSREARNKLGKSSVVLLGMILISPSAPLPKATL